MNPCCCKPVCSHLLWQPQDTNLRHYHKHNDDDDNDNDEDDSNDSYLALLEVPEMHHSK